MALILSQKPMGERNDTREAENPFHPPSSSFLMCSPIQIWQRYRTTAEKKIQIEIERKRECTKCYLLSTPLQIKSNASHYTYFNLRNSSFKLNSVISLNK